MSPTEQPPTDHLDYAKTASRLSEDLGIIKEFSQKLGLSSSLDLIEQISSRLREHRFTVAVVGEFKTGKSTFVNALLGVDVVPTDVVPATATLNRLTYGLESSIEVSYKDGRRQSIGFDKLKEFVTKEFVTTDLLDSISEVVVHHPAPYLLNNVDIIDTPGLNDESSMTSVTLSVLPKIDAAILVISGLAPFSDYTRQFLEERLLSSDLGRVIFIVNRISQLGSTENADRIITHIEKRITQNVLDRAKRELGEHSPEYEVYIKKIGRPRVFGIDALDALQGIMNNDRTLLDRSRFPLFQNSLRQFLNEDRGAIVLQVPCNRILASASEILMTLDLRRKAAEMTLGEFTAKRNAAVEDLNRIRQRKRVDMEDVDRKKAEAVEAALASLQGMDERVKAAVRNAISGVPLTDDEVGKGNTGANKVQAVVNAEVRRAMEREAERVAVVVNGKLAEASDKLQGLTTDLDQTVRSLVLNFGGGNVGTEHAGVAALSAAGMLLGGFGVMGGVVAGYKHGGISGALAGGAVSAGAFYAAATVAAVIGLPFTLPIAIGVGIMSYLAGDKITKALFKGARADSFKTKAIEQTLAQLSSLHLEANMARSVKSYVEDCFGELSKTVSADVDAILENTQRTLEELARQKERQDVLTEEQVRELTEIAQRTKAIQENTAALTKVLALRAAGAAL